MKYLRDLVGQNKRWIVFASFYGIDRSYCHTNPVRKLLLRQSCGSSQILDNRFHAPHSSNRNRRICTVCLVADYEIVEHFYSVHAAELSEHGKLL